MNAWGIGTATVIGVGAATFAATRLAQGDKPSELFSGKIDHAGEVGVGALYTGCGLVLGGLFSAPMLGVAENPGSRPVAHAGAIGLTVLGAGLAAGIGAGLAQALHEVPRSEQ